MFSKPELSSSFEQGAFPLRVTSFCEYQRAFARGKPPYQLAPAEFIGAFRTRFPHIAERWGQTQTDTQAAAPWTGLEPGLPSEHRFAVRVMSLSAKGLDDRVDWAIWHEYYFRGATLVRVSGDLYYGAAQLSRRIRVFPQRITAQLFMLDEDVLFSGAGQNGMTYDQMMINRLQQEFPMLNRRHNETFWQYIKDRNHSPGNAGKAARFGITMDGLKKRVRQIIRPLHCANMDEAVALAVRRLHLEDTDPE